MADRGNEIEKLKRQASDLVAELHARNLAIPAGLLLVLILAAVFVLPKSPTPPPPVNATPIADTSDNAEVELAKVANISVVSAVPLDEAPQTWGDANPFKVGTPTNCRLTKTSEPREFECVIGSTVVKYACLTSDTYELCVDAAGAAGGSTASTGTGSTESAGGGTPAPGGGEAETKKTTTYYTITVTFDGKTFKSIEAGDQIPPANTAVLFYAGPNSTAKKAGFVLGDNVIVQGATADPDLGTFEIAVGDEVVLTDAEGQIHNLTLKKITKVTE